jgi:hypothetical protein
VHRARREGERGRDHRETISPTRHDLSYDVSTASCERIRRVTGPRPRR